MVFEKIRNLICEQFGLDESDVTLNTKFRDDLDADSLDMVEIMMALEDEFDIGDVDESAMSDIESVGDAVNFINSRM